MTEWLELAKDAICRSGTEPTPRLAADVADALMAVALIVQADPAAYGAITNGDIVCVLEERRGEHVEHS